MKKAIVLIGILLTLLCMTVCQAEGKNIAAGDIITLGSYEQNRPNEKDPIEWIVLDVDTDTNRALLVSKYVLDARPYNDSLTEVGWPQCSLREWLNDTFLNAAFNEAEQAAIYDPASDSPDDGVIIIGEGSKQEKIFLFIYTEYLSYFNWDSNLTRCAPTDYAIAHGTYQNKKGEEIDGRATCYWWLMTTAYSKQGMVIDFRGQANPALVDDPAVGVRPAMWINLDSDIF